MKKFLLGMALLCATFSGGHAQGAGSQPTAMNVGVCDPSLEPYTRNCLKPNADGSLNVNASASISGFTPMAGAVANLATTTTSGDVALPAGTDIVVTNTGSVDAAFRIQTGAGTAVTTDQAIKAGAAIGIHVGTATHLSAITASGSTTLNIQGGSGLATGYGGGGSSGGGGGTSSSFSATFPATGTAIGAKNGANMVNLAADASNNLDINVQASVLPTGAATSVNQPTNAAQGSTTSGQTGPIVQGAVTTAAPTYTTGQTDPLSIDTAGNLRVTGGVSQGSTTSGQLQSLIGGAVSTGAPSYTTAQTSPLSLTTAGALRVDGSAVTQPVSPVASATGGYSLFTLTPAASTNATNVKASAGTVGHISVYNNSATIYYLTLYNTSGTPTCGTSIVYEVAIPGNSTSGGGAVEDIAAGLNFSTGIGLCVTSGIAGTGSAAASTLLVNLGFK